MRSVEDNSVKKYFFRSSDPSYLSGEGAIATVGLDSIYICHGLLDLYANFVGGEFYCCLL